jgi:hypothetical protein
MAGSVTPCYRCLSMGIFTAFPAKSCDLVLANCDLELIDRRFNVRLGRLWMGGGVNVTEHCRFAGSLPFPHLLDLLIADPPRQLVDVDQHRLCPIEQAI